MSGQSRNPRGRTVRGVIALTAIVPCLAVVGLEAGEGQPAPVAALPMPTTPPARVVAVEDPQATEAFKPRIDVIRSMLDRGLTNLTGETSLTAAWRTLVSTQDTVGIKVLSSPGPLSGSRPAVVEALVSSLLAAGHPTNQVILWDRSLLTLRAAGFLDLAARQGIRVAAVTEAGYDTNEFYENAILGQLVHGDVDFDLRLESLGRRSYVTRLVTKEMTRLISLTPLLNHNQTGVSGHLASLALGSVDNTVRFLSDPGRLAVAVPEIYALPVLGDRVVLNITDALLAQYYGEETTLLHYSAVLNQLWFSKDPVALDVLAIRELERQRTAAAMPAVKANLALYQNASLVEIGVSDPRNIILEMVR